MFITMNRFKIKRGSEQDFIDILTGRDPYLGAVPGFQGLHLLQGASSEEHKYSTIFKGHPSVITEQKIRGCVEPSSRHSRLVYYPV